jgi:hypothetical protein
MYEQCGHPPEERRINKEIPKRNIRKALGHCNQYDPLFFTSFKLSNTSKRLK